MPLPISHKQELLSYAYIRAVVAIAGAHYTQLETPEYGIDCIIQQVVIMQNGNHSFSGIPLLCQVKSTINWTEKSDHVIYNLDAEAYNKLISLESKTGILIVFRLPKTESQWVDCNEDYLQLRNCCYWILLSGSPTQNTSTISIKLPRSQIFDPQAVVNLLNLLQQNKGSLV